MIIVIDNYDSFTYNLVQYLGELGAELRVFRNDAVSVNTVGSLKPAGIVISPGPGRPCLLYTSPSPRDGLLSRMPSSA